MWPGELKRLDNLGLDKLCPRPQGPPSGLVAVARGQHFWEQSKEAANILGTKCYPTCVVHTHDPNTEEMEAGRLALQSYLQLHSKFKTSHEQ